MPTFEVYNKQRERVGQVDLADEVFGAEVKEHLLWEVVRNQRASRRGGNAETKTRSEVKGGGRKPFRQKGTGRARQGSISNPVHVGGGVAHGPHVRDYSYTVPKKVRASALRSAISYLTENERVLVLEDLELEEVKTKTLGELLGRFDLNSALIVELDNDKLRLSCRNLQDFHVLPPIGLNVYDILKYDQLVFTVDSAKAVQERLAR